MGVASGAGTIASPAYGQAPAQGGAAQGGAAQAGAAAPAQATTILEAYTKPFKKYPVHFMKMGKVGEVKVKEGDVVKKGDPLMKQDTSVEEAEMAILKFDAENRYPIDAAEAKKRLAEVEFKAKDDLLKGDPGRRLEWERAKAELDVAAVQVKQAETELEQKKLKYQQQQTVVKNMTLVADSDGVVAELINDLGSTVDPTHPSLVLVQTNPVTVVVRLPSMATLQLKAGDKLRVSYDRKNWKDATVSFLSPEADAKTRLSLRTVHLDLPNPEAVPAGLQAYVEVPDKLMAVQNPGANENAAAR
jgi:multidrug efflux pump subunit AcrA (membrane-fusion protein)